MCPPGWAVGCPLAPQCLARLRNVGDCGPAVSAWPAILGPCSLEMERWVVGEGQGQGQGRWSPLCSIVPLPLHLRNQGTHGWLGRKKGCPAPQSLPGPSSPTRHPFPAVSGAPTAQRVPASGAMGPAPPRMTVESTNERSSGLVTAQRPHAGLLTVSSAHGRESACGLGSSRGPVSLEVCFPGG